MLGLELANQPAKAAEAAKFKVRVNGLPGAPTLLAVNLVTTKATVGSLIQSFGHCNQFAAAVEVEVEGSVVEVEVAEMEGVAPPGALKVRFNGLYWAAATRTNRRRLHSGYSISRRNFRTRFTSICTPSNTELLSS